MASDGFLKIQELTSLSTTSLYGISETVEGRGAIGMVRRTQSEGIAIPGDRLLKILVWETGV
jgi:hypothetical protein